MISIEQLEDKCQRYWCRFRNGLIRRGLPPGWFRYAWVDEEGAQEYLERKGLTNEQRYERIHPEARFTNPLPMNVPEREALPADRGWWGFSFRDVPERLAGPTFEARLPDCLVVPYRDPERRFWVAILNEDRRLVDLREIHFHEGHARVLTSATQPVHLSRATWITERVFNNYSHWLTAHLPKLILLKDRGALSEVLLPDERPGFIDASIRLAGMEPDAFRTFDAEHPLRIDELTVLGTDRFRPELVRSVRKQIPPLSERPPERRVYISRARAPRRRLLNEEAIWPQLKRRGFERAEMETLSFPEQVRLMQETAVLVAPHGAGLTNMMFCPPGTHVVEIANLGFPNPNFYALASAMGHHYWLVSASAIGDVHPLRKDLRVEPDALQAVLDELP